MNLKFFEWRWCQTLRGPGQALLKKVAWEGNGERGGVLDGDHGGEKPLNLIKREGYRHTA